jgi:uncharacterized protein YegL
MGSFTFGEGRPLQPIPTNLNDDDEVETAAPPVDQTEPEPDTSSSGPLTVQTRIEYSALPIGQTQDVFGLVTVQAAEAKPVSGEGVAERQPMDIVCVLDVSGSMQGDKIRQVQDATKFIIEEADPKDRLSIVSFNNQANRELRLRKMSVDGKNDANIATVRLRAGGGTSIAAGLDVALGVMEQRRQRNKVSAILLLTDGQDGNTRRHLPDLLRRASQANCAIYAFGFGRDHDAALLADLAEQAHTPFTFVEDTDKIREAFAGAVGGLSSILAQQVQLTIKCHVPLKNVNTSFSVTRPSELEAVVSIPDMFAAERRDILIELSVPANTSGPGQTKLLDASARYMDLGRNCFVQTPVTIMEAQHVEEPEPDAEPDEEVSAQRERVKVTRALESAAAKSDEGNFDIALQEIDQCENEMKVAKKKTKLTEALNQELSDARNRMKSRSAWEMGGRAEVRDAAQMHKMQRAINMMESSSAPMKSSKAMYLNSAQVAWSGKSKGNASSSGGYR